MFSVCKNTRVSRCIRSMPPKFETHPVASDGDDILYPSAIPFVLLHFACFGVIWTGVTWEAVGIGIVLYWLRMFAIGAGYHRYFSHRSYSTSRA